MREVMVLGVGMSRFGVLRDQGIRELAEDALWDTLQDAGLRPEEIQVAYCGNGYGGLVGRQAGLVGQLALSQVGITGIPITRVENACASSSCAFREAWAGLDVETQLPLLSTYLGHVSPSSTYWYLSAVPELVGRAAERLERAWGETP